MKFSGKMCLKTILKVTKTQGFTLSIDDTFLEKPTGGCQIDPPISFRVKKRFLQNQIPIKNINRA